MFQSVKLQRICASQKLTREEDPVLYCVHWGWNSHNSEPHSFWGRNQVPQLRCAYEMISKHFDKSKPQLACADSPWVRGRGIGRNREILWGRRRNGEGNRRVLSVVKVLRKCLEGPHINSQTRRLPVVLFVEELSSTLNHSW